MTVQTHLRTIALAALLPLMGGASALAASAHDFTFQGIDGQPLPLSQFAGKTILVVNTASQCGFTPQYKGLEALWQRYRDRGLVVVGVPSDDFGGQEPGSAAQIKDFCEVNYSIDFPMTDKTVVSGDGAHPFYRWAADELGFLAKPRWNFHKYLIGPDGKLQSWFSTMTDPESEKVREAIETLLPATAPKS
ncbi:glutathione peroxidase [Azospirillum thiophilum]|uniref:Glutathione peroxidase n=1 Tax=Azospirillum thiophilum TaxID=528244 RepID=A0AAC8VVP6_9PROT|nr:glutathione peroxidase [Azospirillum thiophilum]ALG70377.1 glutathione peroxidase [Azospirillum thiophilum]KJR65945.1 glutathione peroxidase [Azospirillum thiophilum]